MLAGLGPLGLTLSPDLPFAEWVTVMHGLFGVLEATQWGIGDGLTFGADRYGEAFAQGVPDHCKVSPRQVVQYAWVARQVTPERRDPALSWSHHRAVAALPPAKQSRILAHAKAEGWSSHQLREALQADRHPLQLPVDRPPNRCGQCGRTAAEVTTALTNQEGDD
jgi:hypothetical protein